MHEWQQRQMKNFEKRGYYLVLKGLTFTCAMFVPLFMKFVTDDLVHASLRKGLVINYGEGGGGLQNGKIAGLKLFAPPSQDRVKKFAPPLLKGGNFLRPPPPSLWLKLQASVLKTTSKLFVPPLQHG